MLLNAGRDVCNVAPPAPPSIILPVVVLLAYIAPVTVVVPINSVVPLTPTSPSVFMPPEPVINPPPSHILLPIRASPLTPKSPASRL